MYTYEFDVLKGELVSECKLYPTQKIPGSPPWLYARNNKYSHESIDPMKVGKWMLFISKKNIKEVWDKVKAAVANGDLWDAKVATSNPMYTSHAIMIYTKDYTDLDDVVSVLDFLESSGLKTPNATIYYKTDQLTYEGVYSGDKEGRKAFVYTSKTVRSQQNSK